VINLKPSSEVFVLTPSPLERVGVRQIRTKVI
jgi:hypothetical protein